MENIKWILLLAFWGLVVVAVYLWLPDNALWGGIGFGLCCISLVVAILYPFNKSLK